MTAVPYPGLRPFKTEESYIFFGREEHADQLIEKLSDTRFIAVLGLSGCGKSSLVQAGMIAGLESGYMATAGSDWRILTMRPGSHPMRSLAKALLEHPDLKLTFSDQQGKSPQISEEEFGYSIVSRGPMGLAELLHESLLSGQRNLLLLVDQFEELFRYPEQGSQDEREAFIAMLLNSAEQRDVPIYVVVTMRSDYIGDCTQFRGLPEVIDQGQFLTPRLTREQLRTAILGPARVFGGSIESRLVERLFKDMGYDPDQLPVLQHCLMRMWYKAKERSGDSEEITLSLEDYEHVGGIQNALSNHADEAFNELTPKQQKIAETLFRRITERSPDLRNKRHPVSVCEIAAVAEVSTSDVAAVAEKFRQTNRCFLTPSPTDCEQLQDDSVLDISHESLIRQWNRLNEWAEQEAESAEIYRRLEQTACLWKRGKVALWSTPDLENALTWQEQEKPTAVWASRYGRDFETAREFLEASEQAQKEKRRQEELERQKQFELERERALQKERERHRELELKRARQLLGIVAIAVVVLAIALSAVFILWQKATDAEAEVKRQARILRSRRLAAQAQNVLERSRVLGLLLAVEALNVTLREGEPRVLAAEEVLRQALANANKRDLGGNVVAISPNSRWLVTRDKAGTVRLWELTVEGLKATPVILRGHEGGISTVAISPDSHWLVTVGLDYTIRLWDLTTEAPEATSVILREHKGGISTVAISPDSHWLVTASWDGTVRLWDLTVEASEATSVILWEHKGGISTVAISPDSHWLVTASWDGTVRLWDLAAEAPKVTLDSLPGHEGGISTVAISPDSHWLVTVGLDYTIRLWDLTAEASEATPVILWGYEERISTVAISPDSHWLVTASWDGTVRLWDLTVEASEAIFVPLRGHEGGISTVAIGPDSHWLVTASWDYTIRLWELTAEVLKATPVILRGHEGRISTVTFSPDNDWLTTVSEDDIVRLWPLTQRPEELIKLACRTAGRNLSHEEWEQYFPGEEYRKICPD